MKGTFFNKPIEWNVETTRESWQQGEKVEGTLTVKNHGTESFALTNAGVGLAFADIKKIHARADGALKRECENGFSADSLHAGSTVELPFSLTLPANCAVTDKKASFYLTYGRDFSESHLMLKIEPKAIYGKIVGLLDTFYRFKMKEFKGSKKGVEYKLLPPTSREMANIDSLALTFSMKEDLMNLDFEFQVKKLDTSSITTKVNKETVKVSKSLGPKDYSLGKDMINQDQLLKSLEAVVAEVKLKSVF